MPLGIILLAGGGRGSRGWSCSNLNSGAEAPMARALTALRAAATAVDPRRGARRRQHPNVRRLETRSLTSITAARHDAGAGRL